MIARAGALVRRQLQDGRSHSTFASLAKIFPLIEKCLRSSGDLKLPNLKGPYVCLPPIMELSRTARPIRPSHTLFNVYGVNQFSQAYVVERINDMSLFNKPPLGADKYDSRNGNVSVFAPAELMAQLSDEMGVLNLDSVKRKRKKKMKKHKHRKRM